MTNHSSSPTMRPVRVGNTVHAVAIRPLSPEDECTIDYREVLPLLTQHPGLSAGSVLRETDGIEHIVSDDSHTNLFEQLVDIIDGKYNEMEKSAQSDDDPSADRDDDKYDQAFERLIRQAEERPDKAEHLKKLLDANGAPSWLNDRLREYLMTTGMGLGKGSWWEDWATRQIMTDGTELQKEISYLIFDDSMRGRGDTSLRPYWAVEFFDILLRRPDQAPEWMIREFKEYVARTRFIPSQLWDWSRAALKKMRHDEPVLQVIREGR